VNLQPIADFLEQGFTCCVTGSTKQNLLLNAWDDLINIPGNQYSEEIKFGYPHCPIRIPWLEPGFVTIMPGTWECLLSGIVFIATFNLSEHGYKHVS